MSAHRPVTGNTYAIGRFNGDGPEGYAPVYLDGSHGPTYATRQEAEDDFATAATSPQYTVHTEGNEQTDNFPYVVRKDGAYYNAYSHRSVAEDVAFRNNTNYQPANIYDYDEIEEQR